MNRLQILTKSFVIPKLGAALLCIACLSVFTGCHPGGENENEAQLRKARQLIDQGDFEGAFIELNQALKDAPTDPQVHLNLGWLYLYTDDVEKAEKELVKAEALEATLPEEHHLKGSIYAYRAKQQKTANPSKAKALQEEALKEFSQALQGNPKNAQTYFDEAISLIALDRNEDALDMLDKGFDYIPNNNLEMQVNFQIASCDAHARLQLYDEAIQDCQQALQFTTSPTSKEHIQDLIENMRLMNPGLETKQSENEATTQAAVEDSASD